jgi:hypothetical protein
MFYPAAADQLRNEVTALLGSATASMDSAPKVLIVPHAGYVYSGPVAAEAYRLLAPARDTITRVVLLGPAHRVYLEGMAVPSSAGFATPLGTVRIDSDAVAAIKDLPGVCVSDNAHRDEHSLEVQLPFLQATLDNFSLLPIVVGRCPPDAVAEVIDAAWGGAETLIVVSTDLSHYLPYDEARRVDQTPCTRIVDKATNLTGNEACGAYAVNGLMSARRCTQMHIDAIDLRNSGDTAGSKDRVVGYGAFALH